ncbi:MAG: tetratricopeptide repeat protein [Bacteroidota bacterium]
MPEVISPEVISIKQKAKLEDKFVVSLKVGTDAAAHEVIIQDPFSENEKGERELEWYFEKWLSFPFIDKVKAERAADSITAYGEHLFKHLFTADPDVYADYKLIRKGAIRIEIVGEPDFHALHWETLKDPNDSRPLAIEQLMVRKNEDRVNKRAELQPANQLRVLLMTSRPGGRQDVGYRTISRPLVEALEQAKVPAQIDIVRPGTFKALIKHLEDSRDTYGDGYYHMIHLDMHGGLLTYDEYQALPESAKLSDYLMKAGYGRTEIKPYDGYKAFLFFDNPDGDIVGIPVSADDLASQLNARQIPIAVLNACQSGKQVGESESSLGKRLQDAGVQLVIAMGYSVTVSAARKMMTILYQKILEGKPLDTAIRRARQELYQDKSRRAGYNQEIHLEDWMLPIVYQNRPQKLAISGRYISSRVSYTQPPTQYGFVGRDVDILEIEGKILQEKENTLLLRGMGGAGKTTLLHHVGYWWQKTRLVREVIYFGYDQKAYSVQEIIHTIGSRVGLPLSGRADSDERMVLQALKSERHLLILDNLESIQGNKLAIKNTLDEKEQSLFKAFLQKLKGGKSLILLGSRSGEEWLSPHPISPLNVYELGGLDAEAQSMLAEKILLRAGRREYLEEAEHQADIRKLLKLLVGYPLAMEVVLGNLAESTPKEVLRFLEQADVRLDSQTDIEDKTSSILTCVEYSHSALSEEAQQLLLCLAPFTGVINTNILGLYSEELQTEAPLAKLPFQQWESVLTEAKRWGLMKEDTVPGYVKLQPIFPYFLKTALNRPENQEQKEAINRAYLRGYQQVALAFRQLTKAKSADEKTTGLFLVKIEFENLIYGLRMALVEKDSFFPFFECLYRYLNTNKNLGEIFSLCESILSQRENYGEQQLSSEIGYDFILVTGSQANTLLRTKEYSKARDSYLNFIAFLNELTEIELDRRSKMKASALHNLGIIALEQRDWSSAEGYYQNALAIYKEYQDRYSQAATLHHLGRVAEEQRDWSSAEGYYKEALAIYIEFLDRYMQAIPLHQLGIVAEKQRDWSSAEGSYKEALAIKIEYQDRYSQASTLHHLGIVAGAQGDWSSAEGYYKEALAIKIEYQDRYSQASTLQLLGVVAQRQGDWSSAEKYYKEALAIFIEYQDRYSQAKALHLLGRVAQEQGDWSSAEGYYKEDLAIFIEYQDRYFQAGTLHQLGIVAEEQGEWSSAEGYYQNALAIYKEYKDTLISEIVQESLERLAEVRDD